MVFPRVVTLFLTVLLLAWVSGRGQGVSFAAVAYPQRPVTMIVNFPAGGVVDVTARALVEATKPHFPQPFVVNRPGGTRTVGATEVL